MNRRELTLAFLRVLRRLTLASVMSLAVALHPAPAQPSGFVRGQVNQG
jgi:hypothetical protein